MEIQNFVNGKLTPVVSGVKFKKLSPFNGETLAEVGLSDAMDLVFALQGAKKAWHERVDITSEEKAQLTEAFIQKLYSKIDVISYGEALHQGMSFEFMKEQVLKPCFEKSLATISEFKNQISSENTKDKNQAVGVIAISSDWAFSLKNILDRLVPALLAGNMCIIRVSEQCPFTAHALSEALLAAEVPAGVVSILIAKDELLEVLAIHPSVAALSLVAKTEQVKKVAQLAAPMFKKLQLSAGVKNASMVLASFNYQENIDKIMNSFIEGMGQTSWNSSRLFILEGFKDAFLVELKKYLESLEVARDPKDKNKGIWPLISEQAVGEFQKIVALAKSEHGNFFAGGEKLSGPGFFVSPTFLLDLTNCSVLQQDSLDTPVFIISVVKYQHEFAKWVNTSYLSHHAIIWGDAEKAQKIVQTLDLPLILINRTFAADLEDHRGRKNSFFGIADLRPRGEFFSDVKKLTVRS